MNQRSWISLFYDCVLEGLYGFPLEFWFEDSDIRCHQYHRTCLIKEAANDG